MEVLPSRLIVGGAETKFIFTEMKMAAQFYLINWDRHGQYTLAGMSIVRIAT
tara:strand:- start:70 stop:225 length:156 start_codon:yes stop_codon:yes gene_type:complete